jgi:peptidase E
MVRGKKQTLNSVERQVCFVPQALCDPKMVNFSHANSAFFRENG